MRLRTGHNRLNSHMHRKLKLAPSPTCPCGREEQTVEHVLQRCPLYEATREDVWPVSTSLTTKLWRAGEDDVIHLPSGLDRVNCERQEEEEEEGLTDNKLKTSALCLSWSGTAAIARSGRAGKPQVRSGKTGMCQTVTTTPFLPSSHRLAGLVVKVSASGAEDPGLESRWRRDFSGSSHTSELKIWHSSGYPARRPAL